jgi:4-hydroxy-4-methyl-2-oxoglutarate aldolase
MVAGPRTPHASRAAALGAYPAATLYEALGKTGGMGPEIRPFVAGLPMAGAAYTVKILGAETAAVLIAIDEAPAGSVLVIDTGSLGSAPVWGGTSSLAASVRKLAGVVTNGLARDIDEVIERGVPVYATGVSVRGTLKNHPGWRGVPVSVGGVTVNPGDYLVGDSDGVVVVPVDEVDGVLERAAEQRSKEAERDRRIRGGESLASVIGVRR